MFAIKNVYANRNQVANTTYDIILFRGDIMLR
jgi:hypothetical protein